MRSFKYTLKFLICCFISFVFLQAEHEHEALSSFYLVDENAWKREFFLAHKFFQQKDYYSALESFKRAKALYISEDRQEQQVIDRGFIETYFILSDYRKVIETFCLSSLSQKNTAKDSSLLVKVYKSYEKLGEHQKADELIQHILQVHSPSAQSLLLAQAFSRDQWSYAEKWIEKNTLFQGLKEGLEQYRKAFKSKKTAKWLSILVPGAGYWYSGQPKSGLTSFFINSLLIAASMQCFIARFYALGILTATFEMGWYFGGIMGAMRAAQQHNDQLFLKLETKLEHINFTPQKNAAFHESDD